MNMKQTVNLIYTPPPPAPIKYSFRQLMIGLSIVIVILLIVICVQAIRVSSAESAYDDVNDNMKALSSRLITLTQRNTHLKETSAASQLERKIRFKQKFTDYLKDNGTEDRSKIAAEFMGLANTIVDGVWLTYIEFEEFGQQVYLIGQTNKASQVYQFLENLNDDPIYAGIHFSLKKIEFPEPEMSYKVFSIFSEKKP